MVAPLLTFSCVLIVFFFVCKEGSEKLVLFVYSIFFFQKMPDFFPITTNVENIFYLIISEIHSGSFEHPPLKGYVLLRSSWVSFVAVFMTAPKSGPCQVDLKTHKVFGVYFNRKMPCTSSALMLHENQDALFQHGSKQEDKKTAFPFRSVTHLCRTSPKATWDTPETTWSCPLWNFSFRLAPDSMTSRTENSKCIKLLIEWHYQ